MPRNYRGIEFFQRKKKNPIVFLLILLAVFALAGFGMFQYLMSRVHALPKNNPVEYLKSAHHPTNGKIAVLIGDSITHGSISYDYVSLVRQKVAPIGFTVINAGLNADLAYNVLKRIDDIIRCKPDYVTIMIGVNDVNALFYLQNYLANGKLNKSQKPTLEWYTANLREIVTTLKEKTQAKIALISLPPVSEQPDIAAFKKSGEYSLAISMLAIELGVSYIPLNEKMTEEIVNRKPINAKKYKDADATMYMSIVQHFLLGISFEDIGMANGYIYHVDPLHLNKAGGELTADLICDFLTNVAPEAENATN